MFAYREAPQQSTTFSPFVLLYGMNVRGPMAILRDLCSNEKVDTEVKNVYRYIFDLRNRIEETCKLASMNLETAQKRHKVHFDKHTNSISLNVGDKALFMLPTDHNKLLMRWKGPFSVIDKIGQTDYRIQVGNNQKVFHINMLLEYTERGPDEIGAAVAFLDVPNEDHLSEGLEFIRRMSQETGWSLVRH